MLQNRFLALFFTLFSIQIQAQEEVTYYKDIVPIFNENCLPCHRSNGYGPFSLDNYDDVAKRAQFVGYVTQQRIMPPWKANPEYTHFVDEKILTEAQIKTIQDWIHQGMPKGKKKQAPEPPNFDANSRISGNPDLILKMKEPFLIEGKNEHIFIAYAIPYELEHDTFVKAIEFVPGNRQLVHHNSYQIFAVHPDVDLSQIKDYFVFSTDSVDAIDDEHDFSFFNMYGPQGEKPKEVFHNGWLPGASPQIYPKGTGFYLPKKGVLLMRNFHYSPTPIDEYDQSEFHLYFSDKPVERTIRFAAFKPTGIDYSEDHIIKAETRDTFEMNIRLGGAVSVLFINPHMHYLGKTFLSFAITPQQDTIPLIDIPDWDFNWQEFYKFKKPVILPKGTIVYAKATFDNTMDNKQNPFFPPQDVYFERGSMTETEEMLRLVFLYLPYRKGDENLKL